jgi:(p)ppGpp synthase/HD superfamily hydrolase
VKETIDTFFRRLGDLPAEDVHDIELAYVLSKYAHRHQTRKELDENGKPLRYFEHTRRAALVLIDEAKILDPTMVICALLHDGMEDTRLINYPRVKHWFGREVAEIVRVLTKEKGVDYLARLRSVADNLRSLSAGSAEFQAKQVKETREKYLKLFERIPELAPPQHHDGLQRVVDQIEAALRKVERGLGRANRTNP